VLQSGLAGGKKRFFLGKNRTGKNIFAGRDRFLTKIHFHQNKIYQFLFVFD